MFEKEEKKKSFIGFGDKLFLCGNCFTKCFQQLLEMAMNALNVNRPEKKKRINLWNVRFFVQRVL